jgi:hypothetical protein
MPGWTMSGSICRNSPTPGSCARRAEPGAAAYHDDPLDGVPLASEHAQRLYRMQDSAGGHLGHQEFVPIGLAWEHAFSGP